jgi:hypothetical protein
MYSSAYSHSYSIDGFATFSRPSQEQTALCYTLLMRDGVIEAVDTVLLEPWEGQLGVPSGEYEHKILEVLPSYLRLLPTLGVTPPVAILLSLLRVRGYFMAVDSFPFRRFGGGRLTRDEILLPGVTLDDFSVSTTSLLRPVFDTLWNAFGYERSYNFDEKGNWTGRPS